MLRGQSISKGEANVFFRGKMMRNFFHYVQKKLRFVYTLSSVFSIRKQKLKTSKEHIRGTIPHISAVLIHHTKRNCKII